MKISKNSVVRFHYRLCDDAGKELESSFGGDPVLCLHGSGQIVDGLERAMSGRSAGDTFSVTLAPGQAYGERNPDAVQRVPIKHVQKSGKLHKGQIVSVNTGSGPRPVTVVKVGRFNVDVDVNHPHAGMALEFSIEVLDVREATPDELSHGHAHGPGGAHH